jgi:ketosteroid isomerase-like protein
MSVMNLNQRIGLPFDGACETAFKFYGRCLNGKILFLRRCGKPRRSESGVRVFLNRATNASARAFILCLAIAFGLSCAFRDKSNNTKAAMDAIRQQIAKYTAALDAADIDLASQVWRTSAEVSFIHPAGHAHGWEEVKGIYKFFGSFFSERKLTVRDVSIHVNGETAWAEFYWHFTAKQSKDGSAVQTDGRETQIYEKAGNRWQLVHVHYSGRAIAP